MKAAHSTYSPLSDENIKLMVSRITALSQTAILREGKRWKIEVKLLSKLADVSGRIFFRRPAECKQWMEKAVRILQNTFLPRNENALDRNLPLSSTCPLSADTRVEDLATPPSRCTGYTHTIFSDLVATST